MSYKIRIQFKEGATISDWDKKCIILLEHFGLPGKNYVTSFCEDYLEVNFKNERDAIHAALLL